MDTCLKEAARPMEVFLTSSTATCLLLPTPPCLGEVMEQFLLHLVITPEQEEEELGDLLFLDLTETGGFNILSY